MQFPFQGITFTAQVLHLHNFSQQLRMIFFLSCIPYAFILFCSSFTSVVLNAAVFSGGWQHLPYLKPTYLFLSVIICLSIVIEKAMKVCRTFNAYDFNDNLPVNALSVNNWQIVVPKILQAWVRFMEGAPIAYNLIQKFNCDIYRRSNHYFFQIYHSNY